MSLPAVKAFADWLAEQAAFLHSLEDEAARVLHEAKDKDAYNALMRRKAMFLQALPGEAEKHLPCLPGDIAPEASRRLKTFAAGAERALALNSTFYMSALLYPDNHVQGQPNNLDILATDMAVRAGG
jgi:hypothetical protein